MCIHPFQINEIAIWNAFRFACNFSHRPQSRDLVSEIRNSSFYFSPSIVPSQFPGTLSCHRQTLRTQEKRTLGPYNCSETHMSSSLEIYLGKYLLKYKKRSRYFLSLSISCILWQICILTCYEDIDFTGKIYIISRREQWRTLTLRNTFSFFKYNSQFSV